MGGVALIYLPHKVGGYWHCGTDMARFYIDASKNVHSFYAMAVDLPRKRVDVSLISILAVPLEDQVERVIKRCFPDNLLGEPHSMEELSAFITELQGSFIIIVSRHYNYED